MQWHHAVLAAICVVAACLLHRQRRRRHQHWERAGRESRSTVSVIIPALNEESTIIATLQWLGQLQPAVHEIIVVDGNSSDSTAALARLKGATVLSAERGRASQLNAGAAAATGEMLCFLHADSTPPKQLVRVVRQTLADTRTVLGGFRTMIYGSGGRLLRFMTAHHYVKSYYITLLARPVMFFTGGLCLFGDQTMFCRTADFRAVGGFDGSLPIMEDVDLCIRMQEARSPGSRSWQRGRIRQVWSPPASTSGRRLEVLGNWRATKIHFTIGLGWYLGASRQRLVRMYRSMYSDDYR